MHLRRLELRKFTVFDEADIEFCPGINVIIGANGTGKSHLLKVLYCILKAREGGTDRISDNGLGYANRLKEKVTRVFRPVGEGCGRLVRRRRGRDTATIRLLADGGEIRARITTLGAVSCDTDTLASHAPPVFIPPREVLSYALSLRQAYEQVELNYDETYYDLACSLLRLPLRGPRARTAATVAAPIEQVIGGAVSEQNGVFYVSVNGMSIEAHLLAEGWRKLASLCRLAVNGELLDRGFLFWDEPEANLNPRLVQPVVAIMQRLAALGVQVFVATHDYLLSGELDLAARHQRLLPPERQCDIRFLALGKADPTGVTVSSGSELADIEPNDILDEFAAHYDRGHELSAREAASSASPRA